MTAMYYYTDIISILETLQPQSILAIFPNAENVLEEYARRYQDTRIEYFRDNVTQGHPLPDYRFRITLIAETLEYLEKKSAERLLARLRDVNSEIVYVFTTLGPGRANHTSQWNHTELVALGFRLVKQYTIDSNTAGLYHYDIYDYKHTPDWLNPEHWANPELWDKSRW